MIKKTVLIVCNDIVGRKMAGPAIRCIEVAKLLSASFLVKLFAPKVECGHFYPFDCYDFDNLNFKIFAKSADIIIIQGDALRAHPFLKTCTGVLVADLYCPIPLEYHQTSDGLDIKLRANTGAFLTDVLYEQLTYADHFLCASKKQKDFWLGALTLAGRVNAYRWPQANRANTSDLISLLPFGLPTQQPVQTRRALREHFNIPEQDFVLVWGGGIYQWFDALTPIKAIHKLVSDGSRVHLVFMGVKHPNPGITQHDMCAQAVSLATDLDLIGKFVHFNFGWIDYDDRHNFLLDADIGVSAHFDNPETCFSFRTRMLDYLWCGLPIIATKGDVFGDVLNEEGVGISVDYEDVDGWVTAISLFLNDSKLLNSSHKSAIRYSKKFQWDIVVNPLIERCKLIVKSPDRTFVRKNKLTPVKNNLWMRFSRLYSSGGMKSIFLAVIRKLRNIVSKY